MALLAGFDETDHDECQEAEMVCNFMPRSELRDLGVGHGEVGPVGGVEDEALGHGGVELSDAIES